MDMLVRTPQPHQTESLLGYVLRVSEANGYETPARMLASIGAAGKHGQNQDIVLENLAAVVGCNIAQLRAIANNSADSKFLFFLGQPLCSVPALNALRLRNPAFCPHCVKEEKYIDAAWDLKFIAACPRHRCTLIDGCHRCGKTLSYHRPGLLTCTCGADLTDMPTTAVSEQMSSLMEIILSKARGTSLLSLKNKFCFPIEHLERLSFSDFFEMLNLLARLTLYLPINIGHDDSLLNATQVSEVLSDWPNGFHRFLRDTDKKFSDARFGNSGSISRFKHFYVPMFSYKGRHKRFQFLHDEFIRFNRMISTQTDSLGIQNSVINECRNWVTQNFLLHHWGISTPALQQLIQHGGLYAELIKDGNKISYRIDISKFEPLGHPNDQLLPPKEAQSRYGISHAILRELRKCGAMKGTIPSAGATPFAIGELNALRKSMIGRASVISVEDASANSTLRLGDILSKHNPASSKMKAEFILSYLNGKISALGRTGDAIGDILFNRKVARNLGHVVWMKQRDLN